MASYFSPLNPPRSGKGADVSWRLTNGWKEAPLGGAGKVHNERLRLLRNSDSTGTLGSSTFAEAAEKDERLGGPGSGNGAARAKALNSRKIRDSHVMVDDGALLAESEPRTQRRAVYSPNGLNACEGIEFSPEQKCRAFRLVAPD
jgi:hypothetical protein